MITTEIKINPEYQTLVFDLSKEEYKSLKESIAKNGLYVPIIVNQNGIILDGHHRYKACLELGKIPIPSYKIEVRHFNDPLYEELFVSDININRRQLHDYKKIVSVLKQKSTLRKIAERNSKANLKQGDKNKVSEFPTDRNLSLGGRIDEELGKRANVSRDTIQKVEFIEAKATAKQKEELEKDHVSINYVYHILKSIERHTNPSPSPKLPEGEYDVILADPPWSYRFFGNEGSAEEQYQTMSDNEIMEFKAPSAKNCILFLWVTNPKLEVGISVLKAWGFEYKTSIVWIKPQARLGYRARGRHEQLLIGVKGQIPIPPAENNIRPSSVLEDSQGNIVIPSPKHSQKPKEVYMMIETSYPNRKYIELFARSKYSDRWDAHGLELIS